MTVKKSQIKASSAQSIVGGQPQTPTPLSVDITGGNVEVSNEVDVAGPLTNTQLRATAVPVSGDFSTEVTLAAIKAILDQLSFGTISLDLVVNDHTHEEIHNSNTYIYHDAITLAAAGVQDYMITTPNTAARMHWQFSVDFLFVTQIELYESGDRTGTTGQTIYNSDRNSGNTTTLTLHKGTSGGTTDGTQIYNYISGLATGTGVTFIAFGGAASGRHELILKQNTKYILRVTSSTDANLINVSFEHYEL